MKIKTHLSFTSLRKTLSSHCMKIEDPRQTKKVKYRLHDAILSGFACMYFQKPSLLSFQREMESRIHSSNMKTLMGVHKIPEDDTLRTILDFVDSQEFRPVFKELISKLQRGKQLESYRVLGRFYYIPMDGMTFFSSRKIHCDRCLEYRHSEEEPSCRHQALQAAIVCPGIKQVFPLMPEPIVKQDGVTKNDCEINAAKRFLQQQKVDFPQLPILYGGDGLYSKQPLIQDILGQGNHYLFVAKPKDHKYLFEWARELEPLSRYEYQDHKGRTHLYEWVNQVPLNAQETSIETNLLRYSLFTEKNGKKKCTYQNTWVTDLPVSLENAQELVACGRARWKIENECFNTLKNQGYSLEHNYGHGELHLCNNFYILTLLAFFFHQILERTDLLYQTVRKKLVTLYGFWENIRVTVNRFLFQTWEELLEFIFKPPELAFQEGRVVEI